MGIKNLLPLRPENPEQIADCLDLYEKDIPETPRLVFNPAGAPPRPYTVEVTRTLVGPAFRIPRQVAYYGRGYVATPSSGLTVGGILRLHAIKTDQAEHCSLAVSEFTPRAIGMAVFELLQGEVDPDQAEQLLKDGEVYSSGAPLRIHLD